MAACYAPGMESQRDERVFVVRMWLEPSVARPRAWRGSVQDVASGNKLFVTAPAEIADFISVRLVGERSDDAP